MTYERLNVSVPCQRKEKMMTQVSIDSEVDVEDDIDQNLPTCMQLLELIAIHVSVWALIGFLVHWTLQFIYV